MPFFNLFGGFESLRRERKRPTERVGVGGTSVYGGFLQTVEANSKLTGRERYRTFSEILSNTAVVAAGVRYFLNLVSKPDWKVEPSEVGGPDAEAVAQAVQDAIDGSETPWHRIVRRAAMFKFYGFSVQEWTAVKRPDGTIGILDIETRPQITIERWDLDESSKVLGVVQRSPQTGDEIYIPRWKLVYLVDDALHDNPEGMGLLRHVAEPSRQLTRLEQLEGWGFESDLRGIPLIRAPLAALEDLVKQGKLTSLERDSILKPLKDFLLHHVKSPSLGMMIDSITYEAEGETVTPTSVRKFDLELLRAESTSQAEVAAAIERKQREIARVLGVENLLLGETGAGSLAMARDKSQSFALVVDSTIKELTEAFEIDVVGPLMRLNGWPEELWPTLKTEKIQYRDVTEITQALKDLAQAGALLNPSDPAVDEVLDLLGLTKSDMIEVASDSALPNKEDETNGVGQVQESAGEVPDDAPSV